MLAVTVADCQSHEISACGRSDFWSMLVMKSFFPQAEKNTGGSDVVQL